MTIHRNTNYIDFICGLDTNQTNAGERTIARKYESRWLVYRPCDPKPQAECPISTLRILIEQGKMLEQKHIDYTLDDLLKYGL